MKRRGGVRLPWLAVLFMMAAGCGAGPARPELLVSAAASTRDALLALEAVFEAAHAADLVFNFGGSGDLANQILAAPGADVLLSADEREMDRVEAGGLLAPGTRRSLLSNQLVVIEPADAPSPFSEPFAPEQLTGPAVERLSLADPRTVPAGRYAKDWLEQSGLWERVDGRVLPGIDVRAALAAVESGGADAGIVYRTDVARSERARVVYAVPREQGPEISYAVAVLGGRPAEEQARAFVDFLASPAARGAFEVQGFVWLPAAGAGPR